MEVTSLRQLLQIPDISVPQLFTVPNILNQIKSQIELFIDFCLQNEDFTKIMIAIGIKAPMHNNENMKKIAYIASQILTSNYDYISKVYILSKSRINSIHISDDTDQKYEEIIQDQQTGQLIMKDANSAEIEPPELDGFETKYFYLLHILQVLNQKSPDENCINSLCRILNTLIKIKSEEIYYFFDMKTDILKRMIELTVYPSICHTLTAILEEYESSVYKTEKIAIVFMMIKQYQLQIGQDTFSNCMEFMEDAFNSRQKEKDGDQLGIMDGLVGRDIVGWMWKQLKNCDKNSNHLCCGNALLYLLRVVERMNTDYLSKTLKYEIDILYTQFKTLLQLSAKMTPLLHSNTTVVNYYTLILELLKNNNFQSIRFDYFQFLKLLLKAYNRIAAKFTSVVAHVIVSAIQRVVEVNELLLKGEEGEEECRIELMQMKRRMGEKMGNQKCFDEKLIAIFGVEFCNLWQGEGSPVQGIQQKYKKKLDFEECNECPPQFKFAYRAINSQLGKVPNSKMSQLYVKHLVLY